MGETVIASGTPDEVRNSPDPEGAAIHSRRARRPRFPQAFIRRYIERLLGCQRDKGVTY